MVRTKELKRSVLRMFGDREFYGYEVHKRLVLDGVGVETSRVYRVLNEMLREGLLEGRWEKSRLGPRKRVYKVDEEGRQELDKILLDAIRTIHIFYGKYVMDLAPKINVLDEICSLLMDGLGKSSNIGWLTPQFSPMMERMLLHIHQMSHNGKTYLVKPSTLPVDLKVENSTVMDGAYNDIPLRNDLLDLLVVIDLPPKSSLRTSLAQWLRVLNKDGRLAIMTPTILTEEYEDPLTIGDFVEKHEHEILEQGQKVDKRYLQGLLNTHFDKVNERQIVHMTILQASEPLKG